MRHLSPAVAACAAAIAIATLALPAPSGAQTREPPPLDCRVVERIGTDHAEALLAQLNEDYAGLEREINRRKTLRIQSIDAIRFEGCQVTTDATVTLERRIRRDAGGNTRVVGRVESISLRDGTLCFARHPKVTRMALSNTADIGERVYEWVANKIHPVDKCVPFSI